jgi:hypothetical protein
VHGARLDRESGVNGRSTRPRRLDEALRISEQLGDEAVAVTDAAPSQIWLVRRVRGAAALEELAVAGAPAPS